MESDPIETLLKTTGLSCDDLLRKLQEYKLSQGVTKSVPDSENCSTSSKADKDKNSDTVILNETIAETDDSSSNNCLDKSDKDNEVCISEENLAKCIKAPPEDSGKGISSLDGSGSFEGSSNSTKLSDSVNTKDVEDKKCENAAKATTDEFLPQNLDDIQPEQENNPCDKKGNVSEDKSKSDQISSEGVPSPPEEDDKENSDSVTNKRNLEINENKCDDELSMKLPESGENLRDILRMQLSSLRNMKKSDSYMPDLQKKTAMSFHNLKKKRKSTDVSNMSRINIDDDGEKINPFVSLSDETGFIISEVSGGIDRLTGEEREKQKINNETIKSCVSTTQQKDKDAIKNILQTHRKKMSLNYFSETSYNFKTNGNLQINKDIEETCNKDPGVSKPVKNSEKSPFVSDSLDDFLNESSKLKISYSIPKLGAEDGIKESTKKSPFEDLNTKSTSTKYETPSDKDQPQKDKPKLIKAKTLAEMRRHYEKMKKQDKQSTSPQIENDLLQITKTVVNKPKSDSSASSRTISPHRKGFILYGKKKIWLPTKTGDKCVAVIDKSRRNSKELVHEKQVKVTPEKSIPQPAILNRRPSLLSTLTKSNLLSRVKYKPGPLSKKVDLQLCDDFWQSELKTLPQIWLEVTPELGKAIDPKVNHLLPLFENPLIDENRADFALTALKVDNLENTKTKSFKFKIPYRNNQENFIIRRRGTPCGISDKKSEDAAEVVVGNVLNDIIKYVEIKSIADTLIKDDETVSAAISEEKSFVNTKKKKFGNSRKKRLNFELQRLNCKIIDVASTPEVDFKDCDKPFCRLGCICQSLSTGPVFSKHCGLVECMFECKCRPSDVDVLDDNLSAHTVSSLDDKIKRNLAKVERDFTQTVIHTDNDTILVGPGGRNKSRRICRAPKKYTDYVEDIGGASTKTSDSHDEEIDLKLKGCTVTLFKHDLQDIVPYCLVHKTYNCHCKGDTIEGLETAQKKTVPKIKIIKMREDKFITIKEDSKKKPDVTSARTRMVFQQYRERNSDPMYNKKLKGLNASDSLKNFRRDSSTSVYGERFSISTSPTTNNDTENDVIVLNDLPPRSNKRKQTFEVRTDAELTNSDEDINVTSGISRDLALQRRKKNIVKTSPITPSVSSDYVKIFPGEIKVSIKDNLDMLKIIGKENGSLEYLRILPWPEFVSGFREGKISIWTREKRASALLCNTANRSPPKNFQDIRTIRNKTEIINWILSGELPTNRPANLMHLVLTPKRNHFLISGYCLKNVKESLANRRAELQQQTESSPIAIESEPIETVTIADSPTRNLKRTINGDLKVTSPTTKDTLLSTMPMNKSLRCTHKNIANESKTLVLTSREFEERSLYLRDPNGPTQTITARLPKVAKKFKWRMIYLNSDFSYLAFSGVQYSIKYTDLMDVVKMCNNIKSTITLRNNEFCDHYKHPFFGIFCVPDFQDRLFIGPFLPSEKHNVETLRFMQGNLIDTELFNKMLGKTKNGKNPVWLYETDDAGSPKNVLNGLCIDITKDDDDETSQNLVQDLPSFFKENLFGPPFVEILSAEELTSRKVNRYIITNIPNFGYFPAYQWDNKTIDVFWPTGDKGFKFPNVIFAKNSLVQFLYQTFTPVAESFKINVTILTYLDIASNKPVSPKYLSPQNGPFVCGEFGVYNKDTIPPDLLEEKGVTSIEDLVKLNYKEDDNVQRMVRLFALFLMNNEELRNYTETNDILQWATSEIYVLKKMNEQYSHQLNGLKCSILISTKKIETLKSHDSNSGKDDFAQLIALDKDSSVSETIEIPDSDEEETPSTPGFKRICLSGRIQTPTNTNSVDRSLLKKNVVLSSGQSLLKVNENKPPSPIKIALVNKNNATITVNSNRVKIIPRKI